MKDMFDRALPAPRPLGEALARGFRKRCPACGGGALLEGYLGVRPQCDICGEPLHHHRADDAPAWLTILVVGHVVALPMLAAMSLFDLPMWVHALIWPALALTGIIVFLPRAKGLIVAFQWAQRMHGFDETRPDPA